GGPEHQGRGAIAEDDAGVGPLRVEATPNSDEWVSLPFFGDRGWLAMTGMKPGLRRQGHQAFHDRFALSFEPGGAGGHRAANRAFEDHVAGKAIAAVDQEGEVAIGMTGR